MDREELKKKIKTFPSTTGVYILMDQDDKIVYIGRSYNLKSRVMSHFYSKIEKFHCVRDAKYIETETEEESYFLEDELIEKYRPPLNILGGNRTFVRMKTFKFIAGPNTEGVIGLLEWAVKEKAISEEEMGKIISLAICEKLEILLPIVYQRKDIKKNKNSKNEKEKFFEIIDRVFKKLVFDIKGLMVEVKIEEKFHLERPIP